MAESMIPRASPDVWRDLVAMRAWWKRTFAFGSPGGASLFTRQTDVVKIRNDSASDLDVGQVLAIDSTTNPLSAIDDASPPWLIGDLPGLHPRQIAVLLGPVPAKPVGEDGKYALAQTSGICVAKINIGQTYHRRAYPVNGSHVLTSGFAGPAEIVWHPASTGEQLCLVRLYSPNTVSYWGVTNGEISEAVYSGSKVTPGSGAVDLWETDSDGAIVPTSGPYSATVKNYAPETIATGQLVRISSDDDWQLVIAGQFCVDGFV